MIVRYILAILIISNILAACSNQQATAPVATPVDPNTVTLTNAQSAHAAIETATIGQSAVATTLKVNGMIDVPPQNLVSISCPMGGYLKSSKLLPGMPITKGEVLAIIEDQQFIQLQQDYLLAQSKQHFTRLELNRQKALNEGKAGSNKVLQQAESDAQQANILVAALAEKLKLIHINPATVSAGNIVRSIAIHSPISGFVTKVNVNIGKYVSPSEILFELVNPDDIHLNIKVFEKDIASMAIGKKVIAYTNSDPSKRYECDVILIGKDIAPDGTAEVHCHFDTYNPALLPGMYMNAEIETTAASAYTLPEESVVSFEGKDYVFVSNGNNSYTMRAVTVGATTNGRVAIANAADFGNTPLVTKGAYTLLMKLKNVQD